MKLTSRELSLLGVLIALAVFALTPFARADEPGDPRVPALYGTWTKTPTIPDSNYNPTIQQFNANSGAGIVVTFPGYDTKNPLNQDWRKLRMQRLQVLADEIAMKINFEFDSAVLDDSAFPAIDELTKLLKGNPDVGVSLAGHTDMVGTEEYNDALSERRATAVHAALLGTGVKEEQMKLSHFGKTHPLINTPDRNRENRRVEISILDLYTQE